MHRGAFADPGNPWGVGKGLRVILARREQTRTQRTGRNALSKVHKYGNMGNRMKTTVELPEDLLLEAKRKALETRTTLRDIFERALRRELRQAGGRPAQRPRRIRWVTSAGGLPPDLDVSDRSQMWEWMQKERSRDRH
jgi:hypothetical protein